MWATITFQRVGRREYNRRHFREEDYPMFTPRALMTSLLLLSGSIFCQAVKVDSGLFTTYANDNAKTTLYWVVCGSIQPGEGCYGRDNWARSGRWAPLLKAARCITISKAQSRDTSMSSIRDTARVKTELRFMTTRESIRS